MLLFLAVVVLLFLLFLHRLTFTTLTHSPHALSLSPHYTTCRTETEVMPTEFLHGEENLYMIRRIAIAVVQVKTPHHPPPPPQAEESVAH